MSDTIFSLIVPTRGRAERMRTFLDSVRDTAAEPDTIEVVMVVDADDLESRNLVYDRLLVRTVVLEPGSTMGSLNMAGYRAARGRYLMLLNDDVVVRTPRWDAKVLDIFKTFPDGIVLVHVNDGLFGDKLCTFPLLSRAFCEMAGGICPEVYRRYRIDDHIYNVFNLLATLGHRRIAYLPDVLCEHHNFVEGEGGRVEYVPIPAIHAEDTLDFDRLLDERKALAVRLAAHIDVHRRTQVDDTRRKVLAPYTDSVAMRLPAHVRHFEDARPKTKDARVTIGVVTANLYADHAAKCLELLKQHTSNFDLVIIDNNRSGNFNHSREMNRLIEACRTDYLVLMDDDVWVTEGWLEGMLSAIGPEVGIVTPLHLGRDGTLSYAGVVMSPDDTGNHSHIFEVPAQALPVQTLCSAVMLIDMTKIGELRVDESYSKYFLDIDYGLRIWEAGYSVMMAPQSVVTHLGGATLAHASTLSNELFEVQRTHFVREWIANGRLAHLRETAWVGIEPIERFLRFPATLERLFERDPGESIDHYFLRALPVMRQAQSVPTLLQYAHARIVAEVDGNYVDIDDERVGHLMVLFATCGQPTRVERDWHGSDIYLCGDRFYAIEAGLPTPLASELRAGKLPGFRVARSIVNLRGRLDGTITGPEEDPDDTSLGTAAGRIIELRIPEASLAGDNGTRLILEDFHGYNIVRHERRYYGHRQTDGAFDIRRAKEGGYRNLAEGDSLDSVKEAIARTWYRDMPYRLTRAVKRRVRRSLRRGTSKAPPPPPEPVTARKTAPRRTGPTPAQTRLAAQSKARDDFASAITPVIDDLQGFRIFRYEHKFFCVPASESQAPDGFDYARFARLGYSRQFVGHSLAEARDLIDRAQRVAQAGERTVVFATLPRPRVLSLLSTDDLDGAAVTVLAAEREVPDWAPRRTVSCGRGSLLDWARDGAPVPPPIAAQTTARVVIPWTFPESWTDSAVEAAAARISDRVDVVLARNVRRTYVGENLHRLVYNKAYLSSMFQVVPSPAGKRVLEVGCSDGLVCDLFVALGAAHVDGIDVMKTAGCSFPGERRAYHAMDATALDFPDASFDTVLSIATMEHVTRPRKVIEEMFRVVKPGGFVYVQAGPLYHSPFGHHMFAYFPGEPWIHLRRTPEQMIAWLEARGLDRRIREDLGQSAEEYVRSMLTTEHVNGLRLDEYELDAILGRDDLRKLKYTVSYEGEDLLARDLPADLRAYDRATLVEHGFELAFQRLR